MSTSPAELIACLRQVPLVNSSPPQQGQEINSSATITMRSPLHFFLNCDKLTMTVVKKTTFPFMVCLRGSGMAEVWFLFLSAAYSKTNAGALPQTPGFRALVSRERLVALPHILYHTSI